MHLTKELVDFLVPEHSRTSCTDEQSHGNEFHNELNDVRCNRCYFLALVDNDINKMPFEVGHRLI